MSFTSALLASTILLATANAHMIMTQPVPYSVGKIDNSPITKAQFPCKSQNGFTVSTMNNMAVGQEQTLSFSGSAVHGGGSCQLSVTMDTEPTANSVFKVIKSIEGGCPGVEAKKDYKFSLPDSIPNGKATFAWTWFSKLSGQPELYMNCAPIEVTGGASDKTAFNALPDMLVANIDTTCKSTEGSAIKFPNPGQVLENGGTNDLQPPIGSGCGSSSGTTPAVSSAPAGQVSAAPTSPAASKSSTASKSSAAAGSPSAVPSSPGGVFAPGASSVAPVPTSAAPIPSNAAPLPSTMTTLVVVTASPSSKPSATAPATPAQPTAPASGGNSNTACSVNGAIVCNGTSQFGLCNNGQVVWQDVAAGTTCTNGVIAKRQYNGRIARPRVVGSRIVVSGRK